MNSRRNGEEEGHRPRAKLSPREGKATASNLRNDVEEGPRPPAEPEFDDARAAPRATSLERLALLLLRGVLRVLDVLFVAGAPRTRRALGAVRRAALQRSPYRWPTDFRATLARARTAQELTELTFGATPVSTAAYILWRAGLTKDGSLIDVGAGRGQVLLAARLFGAEARGIELVESHVEAVRRIIDRAGARIEAGDGAGEDLFGVTHVFCAWTAFSKETRARLGEDWRRAEPGTRVVVLTHPLEEETGFAFERSFVVAVPWGFDEAFIYRRVGAQGATAPKSAVAVDDPKG